MTSRSTSAARRLPEVCTARMALRSAWLGRGISTVRSKRPGRSRAGSRLSGRLVAAMSTTPVAGSKPSISASSWLRVCSRSSLPPNWAVPRRPPMASTSSMKMMAGAFLRASANRSRTRAAPTPTNISTKLDPVRARKAPGLAGHRSGHQGLARTGRADHQHTTGPDGAGAAVLVGVLEEVDDLGHFLFGPRVAGHITKAGGRAVVEVVDAGLGAAHAGDAAGEGPAPAAQPYEEADEQQQRQKVEDQAQERDALRGAGYLDFVAQ